jgi:hypothetical protein
MTDGIDMWDMYNNAEEDITDDISKMYLLLKNKTGASDIAVAALVEVYMKIKYKEIYKV